MSERLAAFKFRSASPAVGGVVRTVSTDPVEGWNLAQWQLVAAVECAVVGERSSEGQDAVAHRVFPCRVLVRVEALVDDHVRFFDFGMSGRCPRELERLEDVPANGEVAIPEELFGERDRKFCSCINIALLQFVVTAQDVGVERETLRQVVEVLSLDDVKPL